MVRPVKRQKTTRRGVFDTADVDKNNKTIFEEKAKSENEKETGRLPQCAELV
jgi:hypothetical protein